MLSQILRRSFLLKKNVFRFALVEQKLTDIGEEIKEGKIVKWLVKEGDQVTEFQKLVEVSTDKAIADITALENGTISKIHFQENDICLVGQVLCEIETGDDVKPKV